MGVAAAGSPKTSEDLTTKAEMAAMQQNVSLVYDGDRRTCVETMQWVEAR